MLLDFENLTLQILAVFKCTHHAGFFEVKSRPYAALSLRLKGTGVFRIGEKQLISKPGDVLYIPADTSYEVEYSVNESIVVHLSSCNYSVPEVIHTENRSAVEAHFLRLLDAWQNKSSVHLAKSCVYGLLDMLANERAPLAENTLLVHCTRYIENHFREPETNVEAICKHTYISRSTLQRIFSQRFGISPQRYLTKMRLDYALKLLAEGQPTVKEVALACGFADEKYFSVVFKKAYGRSPSQMRNNMLV